MWNGVRTFNRMLVALETALVGGLVSTVCVVVLLQVGMRYLFAYPNPWSEEVSRYCFIWLSMLGASLAVEHRSHFAFDQVTRGLAVRSRSLVHGLATLWVLGFALFLVGSGIALILLVLPERSPALNLPIAWVYAAVPVSGALMAVHVLAGLGPAAESGD